MTSQTACVGWVQAAILCIGSDQGDLFEGCQYSGSASQLQSTQKHAGMVFVSRAAFLVLLQPVHLYATHPGSGHV